MTVAPCAPPDLEALREKYLAERDERLRGDGTAQYVRAEGLFEHDLEDPYVERVERAPLFDEVTVAVVGGGWSGLIAGARLTEAGVTGVRIIEKGDVGERRGGANRECTPGYDDNEGQPAGLRGRRNVGAYPRGAVACFRYIHEWRSSGAFAGLSLTKEESA